MNTLKSSLATIMFAIFATLTVNSQTVQVGGEPMYPKKDIIDNAINSKAHTTLVAAVKAASLVETLKTAGPFTVFAPTNDAFENLPDGTVETLLKPENKKMLTSILTYHVVAGKYSFDDLAKLIKAAKGKAMLPSVNGGTLAFTMNGSHNIIITDANGNTANIIVYDITQSNGVIHSIDSVVLPKM